MRRALICATLLCGAVATLSQRPSRACSLQYFGRDRPAELQDLGLAANSPPPPELISATEWYPRESTESAGCDCGGNGAVPCGPAPYIDIVILAPNAVWARVSGEASETRYYKLTSEASGASFRLMLYELGAGLPRQVELDVAVLDAEGYRSPSITIIPEPMFF